MRRITEGRSLAGFPRAALAAALGGAVGCAQLLDIPSDPELASDTSPALAGRGPAPPSSTPAEADPPASDDTAGGDVEPGRAEAPSVGEPQTDEPAVETSLPERLDTAPSPTPDPGSSGPAAEVACAPPLVDIVMLVDNSGSMVATTGQAELALPAFALDLEEGGVDYRIILISRHRSDDRDASSEASTSVCVAAPLSGLQNCPAPQPSPTSRFFQYSIKLDARDSFERVLEAASAPDDFGLTSVGWLEWLRPDARIEFVEVTDDDSDVTPAAFVSELAALAPEHFSAALTAPGFLFHAITGVAEKLGADDVYRPDEAIEADICSRQGGSPVNAGQAYQALSRATGGLRQPVCPPSALTARLNVIAADVVGRNAGACPSK